MSTPDPCITIEDGTKPKLKKLKIKPDRKTKEIIPGYSPRLKPSNSARNLNKDIKYDLSLGGSRTPKAKNTSLTPTNFKSKFKEFEGQEETKGDIRMLSTFSNEQHHKMNKHEKKKQEKIKEIDSMLNKSFEKEEEKEKIVDISLTPKKKVRGSLPDILKEAFAGGGEDIKSSSSSEEEEEEDVLEKEERREADFIEHLEKMGLDDIREGLKGDSDTKGYKVTNINKANLVKKEILGAKTVNKMFEKNFIS